MSFVRLILHLFTDIGSKFNVGFIMVLSSYVLFYRSLNQFIHQFISALGNCAYTW